jgi:hypothetical protein
LVRIQNKQATAKKKTMAFSNNHLFILGLPLNYEEGACASTFALNTGLIPIILIESSVFLLFYFVFVDLFDFLHRLLSRSDTSFNLGSLTPHIVEMNCIKKH